MKNDALRIFAVLGLVVLLSAPAAFAQGMKVNVPFDFAVLAKTHAAGSYLIVPTNSPCALVLQSAEGRAVQVMVAPQSSSRGPGGEVKLVFHRYGNQYFLAEVWGATADSVNTLPASKAEKEAVASAKKTGTITVAAAR